MQTLTDRQYLESAHTVGPDARAYAVSTWSMRLVGLGIVAFVPAAFWTGVLALTAPLVGVGVTTEILTTTFCVIASFLSCVFAAVSSNKRQYA